MNGKTYHICRLTAEVKSALKESRVLMFEPLKYENQTTFHFLPYKSFLGMQEDVTYEPKQWFEKCKKQGIKDVKMMMPDNGQEHNPFGFSNVSSTSIFF